MRTLPKALSRNSPVKEGPSCRDSKSSACLHGTFLAGILSARRGSDAPAICPAGTLLVRPIFREGGAGGKYEPSTSPDELAAAILDYIGARPRHASRGHHSCCRRQSKARWQYCHHRPSLGNSNRGLQSPRLALGLFERWALHRRQGSSRTGRWRHQLGCRRSIIGFVGSIKREIARQNIAMRTVAMAMEARYSHQGGRGGSYWGWPPSCGPTWLGLVGWAGLAAAGTIMRTSPGRVAFRFLMKKQALPHPPSPKSVQIRHIPQLRWPATVRLNAMIWGRNTASRRMVFR